MTHQVFGQDESPYIKATIVLKSGEQIEGYVDHQISYGEVVNYKLVSDGGTRFVMTKKVSSIKTKVDYYETIKLNGAELLMLRMADGKIKLFAYSIRNEGPVKPNSHGTAKTNFQGAYYSDAAPNILYVAVKDGINYKIRKRNYIKVLGPLIGECTLLQRELESKVYSFGQMTEIVNKYNSCN